MDGSAPGYRRRVLVLLLAGGGAGCAAPVQDDDDPTYGPPDYGVIPRDDGYRSSFENGWDERGMLVLGQRDFRAEGLPDHDRQFAIGLQLSGAPHDSFLELEFGFWGSARGGFGQRWLDAVFGTPEANELSPGVFQDDDSLSSLEFSIGARKELVLFDGHLRPYIGAGLSGLQVRTFELTNGFFADRTDGAFGLYGQAGFRWVFRTGGSVGFGLRATDGMRLDLGPLGATVDGDYTQWAFSFSFFL